MPSGERWYPKSPLAPISARGITSGITETLFVGGGAEEGAAEEGAAEEGAAEGGAAEGGAAEEGAAGADEGADDAGVAAAAARYLDCGVDRRGGGATAGMNRAIAARDAANELDGAGAIGRKLSAEPGGAPSAGAVVGAPPGPSNATPQRPRLEISPRITAKHSHAPYDVSATCNARKETK